MDISKLRTRDRNSRVLAETRQSQSVRMEGLSAQRRMEMVYLMSMDAIQLHRAGLKAQGFSELEIRKRLRAGP
jgi:hypothetical protein